MLRLWDVLSKYKERYLKLHAAQTSSSSRPLRAAGGTGRSAVSKLARLTRELSDDEEDGGSHGDGAPSTIPPDREPWLRDFHGYLASPDELGDRSIVEWWGVSFLPGYRY